MPRHVTGHVPTSLHKHAKRVVNVIFGRETANRLPRDPPPYGLVGYANTNFAGD